MRFIDFFHLIKWPFIIVLAPLGFVCRLLFEGFVTGFVSPELIEHRRKQKLLQKYVGSINHYVNDKMIKKSGGQDDSEEQ